MEQNPFSIYDFLGYLVPGSVFTLCLSYVLVKHDLCSIPPLPEGEGVIWFILIGFIVFSYTFGFALSVISAEIVERYLICRAGYPSKIRFGLGRLSFFREISRNGVLQTCILAVTFITFLLPVVILDFFIGKILNFDKKYFKEYKNEKEKNYVMDCVNKILCHINSDTPLFMQHTPNFFKYLYHFAYEQKSVHSSKLQNYVALYGFSRTLCLITSLIFNLAVSMAIYKYFKEFYVSSEEIICISLLIGGSAILSYTFFFGFAKFYRRYTDEVLMAICAMSKLGKIPKPKK
ncbi:hypothetical protein [Pseudodesulfovibrio senegalensis]|uniref:Uncharacterized protein n=1 Tax=Pseudodesulfovibrio senegalensis TaxID=1721087 RepID=A0A6N6N4P7_9BACT|nr:hypothetical protein [Pseudodesulfovibrio senegalensis]KAB1442198.1 hypothetical protein F8A88_06980 [Pseudodesulfovibrio senegalensis]